MGAGLVNPAVTVPTPRTVAGNGSVHVVAGMIAAGSWQILVQDSSGNEVRTITGSGSAIDTTWDMTNDAGAAVSGRRVHDHVEQYARMARPRCPGRRHSWSAASSDRSTAPPPRSANCRLSGGLRAAPTPPGAARGHHRRRRSPAPSRRRCRGPTSPRCTRRTAATSASLRPNRRRRATTALCVVGDNSDLGIPNAPIGGCRGVVVPGVVAGHAVPTGNLEIAWPAPGAIQIGGWALDADTPDPIPVHVYVDGTFRGAYVASATAPMSAPPTRAWAATTDSAHWSASSTAACTGSASTRSTRAAGSTRRSVAPMSRCRRAIRRVR